MGLNKKGWNTFPNATFWWNISENIRWISFYVLWKSVKTLSIFVFCKFLHWIRIFCWTKNILFYEEFCLTATVPLFRFCMLKNIILANSNQFRNLLLLWFNPCGSTRSPQKKFCFSQSDGTAGLKMVFPAPRAFVAGKFLSFLSLIRDWLSINWKQSKTFGKLSQSCDDGKKCAAVIFTVVSQASKNSLAGKLQTCFLRTGQN